MIHPMEKAPTAREIILCITAACEMADGAVKESLVRELVKTLTYINNPLVSLPPSVRQTP